ncbi:chromobox protein 7-like [Clarias magur]|uniref:Chromobox protein 7-like n=1 Tax=Clarias magur TaxID=1594786 RepID=A0A8J4TX44_CLAMG|nr:chromobox protein 7-like [Clarias magur]
MPFRTEMTKDHVSALQEAVITDGKPEHCASSTDSQVEPLSTENGSAAPAATEQSAGTTTTTTTTTTTHEHKPITDVSGDGVSQDKPMTEKSLNGSSGAGAVTVQNRASVITVRHLIDRFEQEESRDTGEADSEVKRETDKDEVTTECRTTLQLNSKEDQSSRCS